MKNLTCVCCCIRETCGIICLLQYRHAALLLDFGLTEAGISRYNDHIALRLRPAMLTWRNGSLSARQSLTKVIAENSPKHKNSRVNSSTSVWSHYFRLIDPKLWQPRPHCRYKDVTCDLVSCGLRWRSECDSRSILFLSLPVSLILCSALKCLFNHDVNNLRWTWRK